MNIKIESTVLSYEILSCPDFIFLLHFYHFGINADPDFSMFYIGVVHKLREID